MRSLYLIELFCLGVRNSKLNGVCVYVGLGVIENESKKWIWDTCLWEQDEVMMLLWCQKLKLPGPKSSTWNTLGNGDTIRWTMMYCSYFSCGESGSFFYKTNIVQVDSIKNDLKYGPVFPGKVRGWWNTFLHLSKFTI